jgi:hypothetical protein
MMRHINDRAIDISPNPPIQRYFDKLTTIPPPGGNGCHSTLLSVANLGVIAGVDPDKIFEDLRQAIPPGRRRVTHREIEAAVTRAVQDHHSGKFYTHPRPEPAVNDGKVVLQRIIEQAPISNEADLWEASPIRLWNEPSQDSNLLLEALYSPKDLLWIGERGESGIIGRNIKSAGEWADFFNNYGIPGPQFIPNPLSGALAPNKAGNGETRRGDYCVASFRFCIVEFDTLSREDQIRFWSAVKLPICALIDSGGKSIHGIIDVRALATVNVYTEWVAEIDTNLYERGLVPLGVDSSCKNPSRLSRLPGHFRAEKRRWQRLLWLAGPEGRCIS